MTHSKTSYAFYNLSHCFTAHADKQYDSSVKTRTFTLNLIDQIQYWYSNRSTLVR